MKLLSVRIKNFRSISDATINFCDYTLFVGRNNSGKSNAVDAICTALRVEGWDESRDLPRQEGNKATLESWVDITFETTEDERAGLRDSNRLGANKFKVRSWFKGGPAEKQMVCAYERTAEDGEHLLSTPFAEWKQIVRPGAVVYIPALSRLEDNMKLTGKAPLNELLQPVLVDMFSDQQDTELQDSITQIHQAFEEIGQRIQSRTQQLADAISEGLKPWGVSMKFNVRKVDPKQLLTAHIDHSVEDPTCPASQRAEEFGDGFQRHLVFTLLKLRAKHAETKADKKPVKEKKSSQEKVAFNPVFSLLVFEEPEAFLHPEQIDVLHEMLKDISRSGQHQVLVTTHNSQFSSKNIEDLTSFARLTRESGQTVVRQVSRDRLREILEANYMEVDVWRRNGMKVESDDLTVEMEEIKLSLWMNPIRCMAFFADRVLLVEGPTEVALFSWMRGNGYLGDEMRGVFVMDSMGKYNMHKFMSIFNELGIEHGVLHDADQGTQMVYVDATIQKAKAGFTLFVEKLPSDIEGELGIESCPRSNKHRKPQHVLYSIHSGKVSKERLQSVARKVGAILRGQRESAEEVDVCVGEVEPERRGHQSNVPVLLEFARRKQVPLYDLRVAAGGFSTSQSPEPSSRVFIQTERKADPRLFVAKVLGPSMEPEIPDGAYALFRKFRDVNSVDPEMIDGKRVLVERHEDSDSETGGRYTLKVWRCESNSESEVVSVELRSLNPEFAPRKYSGEDLGKIKAVAEFLEVVSVVPDADCSGDA